MTDNDTSREALARALKNGGGAMKVAAELKIRPQAVYKWQKAPVERCADLERLTGVPRSELRPDIFRGVPAMADA